MSEEKPISLPVHPASRKILLHDLGGEPSRVNHRETYYYVFQHRKLHQNYKRRHYHQTLTETFRMILPSRLSVWVQNNAGAIGILLWKLHSERMVRFVWAQVLNGSEAMTSLKRYFEIYDINADDLSIDTAYKKWQRFKWKMEENGNCVCVSVAESVLPTHANIIPLEIEQAERYIYTMISSHLTLFQHNNGRLDTALIKHMIIYAVHDLAEVELKEVAERYNVPYRTAQYSVQRAREFLEMSPKALEFYESST